MNKTIIININGSVFHIEEEAYEILRNYMTEVKRHFGYSKDSDEIVTDIENRLAEMFNDRLLQQNKQVIILQDVEEVIAVMGKVSDFGLPEETEAAFQGPTFPGEKKLMRDVDDKVIAGVCSGFAHYLDIEVKWVRLVTVLVTLATGIGIPLYIILWAVLPEALTRQDKMAMKGEPINLQNFKKSFDEEPNGSFNASNVKSDNNLANILEELVSIAGKLFKVLLKIIAIAIMLAGIVVLLVLALGLISILGFFSESEINIFPINVINIDYRAPIFFAAFLLLLVPLTALILFATRVIFDKKLISKTISFTMLMLWLTGLGMAMYYGSKIASEFKEEARFEQNMELVPHHTLHLKLNPKKPLSADDSLKLELTKRKFEGIIVTDDDDDEFGTLDKVRVMIEKSDDNKLTVIKEFSGRGQNFESALKAAQRSRYQVVQKDSVISFDKYLSLSGDGLFRAQSVFIRLRVPENTRLVIDGKLNEQLNNINLWDCRPENSSWEAPSTWIMTGAGLKCATDSLERTKIDSHRP